MRIEQAKRLKELEQENSRLKRLVADLSLDNAILKEAARRISTSYGTQPLQKGLIRVTLHTAGQASGKQFCGYHKFKT